MSWLPDLSSHVRVGKLAEAYGLGWVRLAIASRTELLVPCLLFAAVVGRWSSRG